MKEALRQFRSVDVFAVTFCSTITMGIAFLPYVSDVEVRSAWLKLIVGSTPYFFLIWLIYLFTRKYPDYDFFGALKQNVWKGLYWFLMLYFILSTLFSLSKGVNDFNLLVRTFLLFNTPKWSIILSFLLVVFIGVYYGIQSITRFAVLFFTLEALFIIFICIFSFGESFHWFFVPPIFTTDILTFLRSSLSDAARYGGTVVLLGYIMYVKKNEPIGKAMSLALLLSLIHI